MCFLAAEVGWAATEFEQCVVTVSQFFSLYKMEYHKYLNIIYISDIKASSLLTDHHEQYTARWTRSCEVDQCG